VQPWYPAFEGYVTRPDVRAELHVGNRTFQVASFA
jgi:hypothetical protein